jgi:hypothetical protein
MAVTMPRGGEGEGGGGEGSGAAGNGGEGSGEMGGGGGSGIGGEGRGGVGGGEGEGGGGVGGAGGKGGGFFPGGEGLGGGGGSGLSSCTSPTHGGYGLGGGGGSGRCAGGGRGAPGGGLGGLGNLRPPTKLARFSPSCSVSMTVVVPRMAKIRKPMQQQGTRQYAIIRVPFPPRVPPPRTSRLFSVQGLSPVASIATSKSSGSPCRLLNVSLETSTDGMARAQVRASTRPFS